ncbi:MAG: GntR family transcriptional regulator, partial [Deltaproteobacteria bacterium]|nr:GntR family transcriptional regulator [Deltaproteobacteria bacterium]
MANSLPTLSSVDTPPSMQDIAFQTIKQAIMRKEFLPGTIYSEQAVAKEMGMSKTPVHQALLDLENKGFVSLLPRKGFRVNVLSAQNIRNMFEMRRVLERAVILKITPRLSTESIEDLEKILEDIKQTVDPFDFQKHDRAFHRYMASLSNNTYIINALNTVWDLSDWVGASILRKRGGYDQAANEHRIIFEFLTVGNAEKAAAAME